MIEIYVTARETVSGLEYEIRELERKEDGVAIGRQAKTSRTVTWAEIGNHGGLLAALGDEMLQVAAAFADFRA